jgi:hypothetical protein
MPKNPLFSAHLGVWAIKRQENATILDPGQYIQLTTTCIADPRVNILKSSSYSVNYGNISLFWIAPIN